MRLPAKDLDRARAFYSEKLGLDPVERREGGLRYVCPKGEFAIYVSAGARSGAAPIDAIDRYPTPTSLRYAGTSVLPGAAIVSCAITFSIQRG
ncbi:VOC family protein [Bradyrhizobium sp. STM 3557]|uniref:VOC family protein n=1 Tax=Bradyrhizobium sp. STM 3557 TaxID=578920 RepID=UPI00388D0E54